jgi:hypothetical protein
MRFVHDQVLAALLALLAAPAYAQAPVWLSTPTGQPLGTVANPLAVVSSSAAAPQTLVPLDIATVTTGGTAVVALNAGHRTAGGWLYNPSVATVNLCIAEVGTATGTSSAGNTTCVVPGQKYDLTANAGAVSVISSDSAHAFSGYGKQ